MAGIVVGVESNEITVKNTKQDLVTDRQNTIDLAAGERRVQEETKLDVLLGLADFLAEHGREQHQMVIMDPNEVVVLNVGRDSLGEETVRFGVGVPGRLVKRDFTGMVVEEGPHDGIYKVVMLASGSSVSLNLVPTGKSIVVTVGQVVIEHDGNRVVLLLQSGLQTTNLLVRHFKAGPAIPLECR